MPDLLAFITYSYAINPYSYPTLSLDVTPTTWGSYELILPSSRPAKLVLETVCCCFSNLLQKAAERN